MFRASRNRAAAKGHPSMWPFYALRRLAVWMTWLGAGLGAIVFVYGANPVVIAYAALWAGLGTLAIGMLPAVLASLLDLVFVGRRRRHPYSVAPRAERPGRQQVARWAVVGGWVGAAVGAGYAFVYINAFVPGASLDSTFTGSLAVGIGVGVAAGSLAAIKVNVADSYSPAVALTDVLKRGAFFWTGNAVGFGVVGYLVAGSYQATLMPAVLVAAIGAGVVPQLAATPPIDLRMIPPPILPEPASPTSPTAPSPGPNNPEGGLGRGSQGDPPSATPHKIPQNQPTRSGADSVQPTPTEVVNG